MSCLYVSVLSNLCVKNGLRVCFYSHWVVVRSKSWVPMKSHRCGLHLHCDQTWAWRSGRCIRALLDHSHAIIIFKRSRTVNQNSQDCFMMKWKHVKNIYFKILSCFHLFSYVRPAARRSACRTGTPRFLWAVNNIEEGQSVLYRYCEQTFDYTMKAIHRVKTMHKH